MTDCPAVSDLDEYVDGLLPSPEQARIEAHLEICADCRREVDSLRALLIRAGALPRAVLPARDLWSGIEARLHPPQPARIPRTWQHRGAARWAAAIGLILLGATLATLWQRRGGPTEFAVLQARYAAATASLAERLEREPLQLTPGTRAVVERNLAIVDAAIREAESALLADTSNAALEQMLLARYEQRLALLRHATQPMGIES